MTTPSVLRVSFARTGEFRVPEAAEGVIEDVVAAMVRDPSLVVVVQGHADARGTRRDNLRLSKRRAQAVARELMQRGIEASRLRIQWFGERKPAVIGDGSTAWAANRRTDLAWRRNG
jgi:peptidoglycan-associated lipoprotein